VERLAGFPSGRLFLDSVEQALAAALVDGHAVRRPAVRMYRGGLSPTRLRRVTELVHARIEDDLTLNEMAESAGLSTAHFCQMFRKSTGESPHRFVLGQNSRHSSILRECSVVSAERALPNDRHFWFRSNPKEL
jgi:AraC family transcriptional regulator